MSKALAARQRAVVTKRATTVPFNYRLNEARPNDQESVKNAHKFTNSTPIDDQLESLYEHFIFLCGRLEVVRFDVSDNGSAIPNTANSSLARART